MATRLDDRTMDRMEKIANDAAMAFSDSYYITFDKEREKIAEYYIPHSIDAAGLSEPQILWQGHTFHDPQKWQTTVQQDMPLTFSHVERVNCQVMNHRYYPADLATAAKIPQDENMSFLVVVDGHVRLHERARGPMKQFNESFVLVRNREAGELASGRRKWLVLSQSCRFVASHTPSAGTGADGKAMDIN